VPEVVGDATNGGVVLTFVDRGLTGGLLTLDEWSPLVSCWTSVGDESG
jgi:hypothetical protein